MAKPKSYYSYTEQQPHEQQVYEAKDYQSQILDSLMYLARDFDDDDDNNYDDDEEDFDDEDGIEGTVSEEEKEGFMYVFNKTQRWKTKIFREYFYDKISSAL